MNKRFGLRWPFSCFCIALGIGEAASAAGPTELKIIATPSVALYGEPFSWKVTGLRPGERVTVKAVSTDAKRILWESEAVFEADASGAVDVGKSGARFRRLCGGGHLRAPLVHEAGEFRSQKTDRLPR